jgi:hypothetical protein
MTAEAWTALAAWATFGVAIVAAWVGLKQYRATSAATAEQSRVAQALAEEEARPYVVAYMEQSAAGPGWVDLVVRNYGKTAARGVRLEVTPELRRSAPTGDGTQPVRVFEEIGLLAPGQEWRCFWDRTWRRREVELPDRYEVALSYSDQDGDALPVTVLPLDWGPFVDVSGPLSIYGLHHAAEALRGMEKTLGRFTEHTGARGLRVYTRDGDAKDRREWERLERLDELNQQAEQAAAASQESAADQGNDERPPAST